jgi:hypothetical protein
MKAILKHPLRWAAAHRYKFALLFAFTIGLVLLAPPGTQAADVFNNIGPAPQLPPGGWVGRYPVEHYSLDQYFPAISVGFTSGVDTSGVAPMIAYFGAQVLWLITCFLANGVILLFALAFNLNLLTGNGTPGSGALTPVSAAIHNLYTNTFGTPWLIAMVTLVGCWAMWKALVQRRYTETAGALAVSLLYFVVAIGIVTQPEQTIGPASKLSNQLSTALLSLTNEGSVSSETKAKTGASNQLFELLVLNPWTVLQFGGIEHCATVTHGKPHSVAVRPLSSNPAQDAQLAAQLENGTEVKGEGGKTCINNRNKYATHFLAYPFQSSARNSEHEALEHGDTEDLPESDPAKSSGTYPLGPADEPAAEAMGKGGQYQRLLLAIVILLGEVGAYLLLGALALGVILAQILLLTLLAFAPVALLIGIFPGRGHDFFRAWIAKLAGYLARKVVYSLILAVVLAVCQALDDATSNLGWLLAFALQAAFLWTIFLQRDRLSTDLLAGTVGPRAARESTNKLANLYFATGLARMMSAPNIPWRSNSHTPPTSSGGSQGNDKPEGDEPPTPGDEGTGGGTPPPGGQPSGGGMPSGEEPSPDMVEPGPHETPTLGPGSPPPNPSVGEPTRTEDPQAPSGGTFALREEIPSAQAGSPPVEDELAATEEEHEQAGSTNRPSPNPMPPHNGRAYGPSHMPPTTTAVSRAAAVSPSTPGIAAPAQPAVPTSEVAPHTPSVPATPAFSPVREEREHTAGLPEAPANRQAPVADTPAVKEGQSMPAIDPAIPAEEPAAALLVRARQTSPATRQTTKEDESA